MRPYTYYQIETIGSNTPVITKASRDKWLLDMRIFNMLQVKDDVVFNSGSLYYKGSWLCDSYSGTYRYGDHTYEVMDGIKTKEKYPGIICPDNLKLI